MNQEKSSGWSLSIFLLSLKAFSLAIGDFDTAKEMKLGAIAFTVIGTPGHKILQLALY